MAMTAALLSSAPQLSWASGDLTGVYIMMVLFPAVIIWVAGYLFVNLIGDIYRRVGISIVTVPLTVFALFFIYRFCGFIDKDASGSIWSLLVTALLTGGAPVLILKLVQRE